MLRRVIFWLLVLAVALVMAGGVSWYVRDYNLKNSEAFTALIEAVPEYVSPLDVSITVENKIWADGGSFEHRVQAVCQRLQQRNAIKPAIDIEILYDEAEKRMAFSQPDKRHIVLTNKVLSLIRSDDELAALIGHEMAHIEYNIESFSHQLRESGDAQAKHFKQEFEADVLGAMISARAGYNPVGASQFFKTLLALESFGELTYDFSQTLQTHPPTAERIKVLDYVIQKAFAEDLKKTYRRQWSIYDTVKSQMFHLRQLDSDITAKRFSLERQKEQLAKPARFASANAYNDAVKEFNNDLTAFNQQVETFQRQHQQMKQVLQKYRRMP